ncbi:enhancer of mRNA-decapping protein 4-like isoform X2 [Acipenser ruthenus]|uniref:enhancer of mRNA-decapping protein 4-like isoform X2 n=1 Tax=Acipenser ruthenus TaxID=7906 RepID=UPI0027413AA7|nr:enhancer of mRNA-decapping protein 4-like isoform X2 [Acipenser ruthenus]
MASNSNIDIEDATQHLRDILKLDRPGHSGEETGRGLPGEAGWRHWALGRRRWDGCDTSSETPKKSTSFNGELNGLMGADLIAGGDRAAMSEISIHSPEDMNMQEKQTICLSGEDSSTCIIISARDVEIVASHDSCINSKARGSNKVKIQPVAKYDWEHKYYYGNLIAVSNSYLAYAIRGANSIAMIRVLNIGTAERTLLKGFTGGVTDLAFAHLNSNQLACVDEAGNLFVWQLTEENGKIQDEIIVHVTRPESTPLNGNRRIIWCPFIPEENEENAEDGCQTLALLHEDRAEVWDLEIIRSNNSLWPMEATDFKEGFITVKGHNARISEGALSPDGTVLASASHDGCVKFWQIYIEGQDQPRCLHDWKPHNGKPLSCLLFCDNHKKQDPEVPFWRFLITGADQNQELKMWCTVSWTCLQTIQFSPDPFNSSVLPSLKASLDLSAEYLILTDVQRKVLYVMELLQDQEKGRASFTAISEFLLTHPVLSFGIQDVSRSRQRHTEVLPAEEESESVTVEGSQGPVESKAGVQIKLYCVHTKSLQDVQIWFQPHLSSGNSTFLPPSGSHEDFSFADQLTDVSMEGLGSDKESGRGSPHDLRRISDLPTPADFLSATSDFKPKLMTPDAFMTPSASTQQISASPGSSVSTLTAVTGMSSNCVGDSGMSRTGEEMTKLSLDSSMTLSNSTDMQGSPRNNSILIPGLADQLPFKTVQVIPPANPPLSLDLQSIEPILMPQASPTRERSPDVISSASTAMSQDIPEIASETLQRGLAASGGLPAEVLELTLHSDSMASAASALHLLSPRNRHNSEHSHHSLDMGSGEAERLSSTPSLLETALSQESAAAMAAAATDNSGSQPWPAAPDITRETRNSLIDSSREDVKEKHKSSSFHRHAYHLPQHDSQDASAEQSDHDDEVASLASSSGNYGSKSTHRLPVKEWKSPRGSPKLKRKSKKEEGDVAQARLSDHQMSPELQEELLSLVRCQQREISELRQSQLELMQRLTNHMDAVQSSIMGHVERVMITQQEQEQRRMERILADGHDRNRQFQEQLSQQLSQSLSNTLSNRLDKTVRDEMKKTVPQSISKSLEPVTGQLSNTIAAKLTAVEGTLKENITKMVKSKNTTDAIGRAAADALQGPIQAAYKEAFQSIVLPVFEKGCQSMFQQINDSFKSGTQEYIQQLENHLKNKKLQEHEVRHPMMGQLQQMIDTFQNSTDQLSSNITASMRSEVQHQLHITVGNLQDSILTQVQRIVKGEVSMAMKEQQAAVTTSIMQAMRSAAGTPIPSSHLDYQTQQANILQLLQQGQLNQAFQQALSAADLNLVLYVCETVNSQQVFGQNPCPLIQPVLLSLIQQLSTNLATRTELKISYLEDAVMNLDHGDPVTRDHMSSVLSQVRQKLFQFLQADPHNVLSKRARRLMMMLQGLINHGMS